MRTVHCTDAITWLNSQPVLEGSSLVASLPDISEFELSLSDWKNWFTSTAKLIMEKTPDEGVAIFFQSDIKVDGTWVDKGFLCQQAAMESKMELLWHKIVCRSPAGIATYGRPSYSHLLCFSRKLRADVAKSSADVLPDGGDKDWQRGMGLNACLLSAKFILEQTSTRTLVNPFCGHGSMLAAANILGLEAIGIEKSPKRAEKAKKLQVSADHSSWIQ